MNSSEEESDGHEGAPALDKSKKRGKATRRTKWVRFAFLAGCLVFMGYIVASRIWGPWLSIPWAKSRHWSATMVRSTDLKPSGIGRLLHPGAAWRDLPFTLTPVEEADARKCVALAQGVRSTHNGVSAFATDETRTQLEDILLDRPDFFYAEFLLATWYRENGEAAKADELFEKSFEHAPVVLLQRFVFDGGRPLVGAKPQLFGLECDRVQHGSLDPSLKLLYPFPLTDDDGRIALPAYDTVFRTDDISYPSGYDITTSRLGWFETRTKVGLLPVITVRPAGTPDQRAGS